MRLVRRVLKLDACIATLLTRVATMMFLKLPAAIIAGPILTAQAVLAVLCDNVDRGYQCQPEISHYWGQYSPFFSVSSDILADVPAGCNVTFAQILSRHGARDPTASKTKDYNATIQELKANVSASVFTGKYAFLANYSYTLGADQLTTFGQQELINSGVKFFDRYKSLAQSNDLFIRSSSEARVVESAENFTQGFHSAKKASGNPDSAYPYVITVMSEADGSNNTLNHDLCTNFESDDTYYSSIANKAQSTWAKVFVPNITARLNKDLPGAQFNTTTTINMMDLCSFNTVASETGAISPFCALFSEVEWHAYGYYESLNKFYGYGPGNPLGPTQGVGFAAELLSRLTGNISYVTNPNSYTSINHTLDSSRVTFPLGRSLYADFSHDNDMTAIFSALGLYNGTIMLPNMTIVEAETAAADGYSAAWTVPFAARAYFEKMTCASSQTDEWHDWNRDKQELVRVIVNDRVVPLIGCGADKLGRCTLENFVESQAFVREGGRWSECFP